MATSSSTPTIVQGGSYSLALPLRIYIIADGQLVLDDYTPATDDEVIVRLKGERRTYTYTPTIAENIATISLGGYELAGYYAIEVSIMKASGARLRSLQPNQLHIVESLAEISGTEIIEGVEQDVLYLDPQTFIAGKDGRGIVSIEKTATAGLVDTYTVTYTDDTTSTFEVTNGRDGEDGQPGQPGAPGQDGSDGVGIASVVQTTTSTESGGQNIVTVTLTNGQTSTFSVYNGAAGKDGKDGKDGVTPDMSDYYTKSDTNTLLGGKQDELVSGTNIKTINSASVLGGGNIALTTPTDLANYCPIIEDTRSSAASTITGVAPFSTLVDGQMIRLCLAYASGSTGNIQLTLSGGTTTNVIPFYYQYAGGIGRVSANLYKADFMVYCRYDATNTRWIALNTDTNTLYSSISQNEINTSASANSRLVTGKILRDNFYLKSEVNNLCPIIQDTRSSAVAAITGVAPFASLVDGQRIVLRLAYATANSTTLNLTLSDGTTTTGAKAIYSSRNGQFQQVASNYGLAGTLIYAIYDSTNSRWNALPVQDANTTYATITQAQIDAGSSTSVVVVTPKLLCDNFSKLTPVVSVSSTGDVSQTLDPYKWYSFGELDSLDISLTAPASGKLGEYFGKFSTSASWTSLSVPSGVTEASGNDTIAASKTYEFNIVDDVILVKEV